MASKRKTDAKTGVTPELKGRKTEDNSQENSQDQAQAKSYAQVTVDTQGAQGACGTTSSSASATSTSTSSVSTVKNQTLTYAEIVDDSK